ncbi:MAG: hypothetical protein P0116_00680 [Candidatus Nitrosocosmicus sp.]|nr:hypothetical protein [Candidatus Nitrosocosmicus sp.]
MSGKEQVNMLLFNKWDTRDIEIVDEGLKRNSLHPSMTIPVTFGRHEHQRLKKAEVNIIERLVNKLMHFGKDMQKHRTNGGKKTKGYERCKNCTRNHIIETGKNP